MRGPKHRKCMLTLLHPTEKEENLVASHARIIEAEGQYTKQVLRPVAAVIKFLGERGLPLQ